MFYKKEVKKKDAVRSDVTADDNLLECIYTHRYVRGQSESPVRKSRKRHVNEAIELELLLFKREIEEKFAKSIVNRLYQFPRAFVEVQSQP